MNLVNHRDSPILRVGHDLAFLGAVTAGHRSRLSFALTSALGAVFRTALLAVLDALRVEHAAQDVIAHARQVLHAAAADHAPPSAPAGYGLRRGCSRSPRSRWSDAPWRPCAAPSSASSASSCRRACRRRASAGRLQSRHLVARLVFGCRGLRISWLIVGIDLPNPSCPARLDHSNAQNGRAPSAPGADGRFPFHRGPRGASAARSCTFV